MIRNHIIISGTGRAGTTFLVQLFTELGLDTGFHSSNEGIFDNCNAGMELDLRSPDSPYIVKSPWICDYLEELLHDNEVRIDHAIIPMRDLHSAAESRRYVSAKAPLGASVDNVPGGLWHTDKPGEQENILTVELYKLIYALVKYDIPITFLYFPRFVNDPEYTHSRISFMINRVTYTEFLEVFNKVSHPEMIHNFGTD